MSKRALKTYLKELNKEQLEDQILDLYTRFKDVKEYYNFAFNPNEDKLMEECKFKITNEYFPVKGRKAKKRRSVAQKYIRHFKTLGVESSLIADIMLYNIEIAITFTEEFPIHQDSFYLSMQKSFEEAMKYISDSGMQNDFSERIKKIQNDVDTQNWFNKNAFN